jgi:hypothetical protein
MKRLLFLVFVLLFPAFPLANVALADQCLSQFPDSMWSNGIPANLPTGPDLILTAQSASYTNTLGKTLSIANKYDPSMNVGTMPSLVFSDYLYSNNPVSLNFKVTSQTVISYTYTYLGASCSERTIHASGHFNFQVITPIEMTDASYEAESLNAFDLVKASSFGNGPLNFLQKDFLKLGLKPLVELIDQTKNQPLKLIKPDFYPQQVTWPNSPDVPKYNSGFDPGETSPYELIYVLYAQHGIDIRGLFLQDRILGIFQDGCAVSNASGTASQWQPSPIFKEFFFVYFLKPVSTCKSTILVKNLNGKWLNVGDEYIQSPVIGPLTKSPAKNTSITITCIKGKLTKQVTGINPICPAGYKKK